ncbi:MAG: UPF0175 family protein [Pyrinomonadaceae bacterium]|nr:UPF0175 family protein [Pyrinomonadaceae bacterium]
MSVSIEIPLNLSAQELDEVKHELAVVLYQRQTVGLGEAATIAGLTRIEFQRLLASRHITLHYEENDFDADVAAMQTLQTDSAASSIHDDRVQELTDYLARMEQAALIHPNRATRAWQAWEELLVATSHGLPVPDAAPGPDGELLFAWDRGEHHLELEVFPTTPVEFFYLNRVTDAVWGYDHIIGAVLPQVMLDKLSLFVSHE